MKNTAMMINRCAGRLAPVLALVVLAALLLLQLSCASPEQRKANAEARWQEERVNLIQEYKDCVAKHNGDTTQCQYLLDLMKTLSASK